ncbi:MAG: hypothetical protein LBK72_05095 [Bifidobacteriaceae bacterium]|jgi:hypothetical protein|nr:hypothetical protein [Bifidobacteriaceae bacterium]
MDDGAQGHKFFMRQILCLVNQKGHANTFLLRGIGEIADQLAEVGLERTRVRATPWRGVEVETEPPYSGRIVGGLEAECRAQCFEDACADSV